MRVKGFSAPLSIQKKLLLLLLVVCLPSGWIIVQSSLDQRGRGIQRAQNNAMSIVQSLVAQQEQIAAGIEQTLGILAQLPEVQKLDAPACNRLFRNLNRKYPFFSILSEVTADGNLFAASGPFEPGTVNVCDRKNFRDALSTLDFSAGEFVVGRTSKVQSINFAYPVFDLQKKLIGVVNAGFRLEEYPLFLSRVSLPAGAAVIITDHAGVRLYSTPETSAAPPGKPVPVDLFRRAKRLDHGIFERIGQDGISRIYAFQPMRLRKNSPIYMYVFASLPKDEIFKRANREMARNLFCLGIASLIAACLAWGFGNFFFIRPITRLVDATKRFGEGDLLARTGLPHNSGEMGLLAESFDRMASQCEQRDAERMMAEEVLQKSEKKYRELFKAESDALFLVERDTLKFLDVNPAAEKMYGYSRAEWLTMHSPDISAEREKTTLAIFQEHENVSVRMHRRKDGSIFPVEITGTYFAMDGVRIHLAAVRDISIRVQAEQRLRESEERFRIIFEQAGGGVAQVDARTGRFVRVNKKFCDIVGYSHEELLTLRYLDITHPDHVQAGSAVVEQILAGKISSCTLEKKYIHKNGSTVWVTLSVSSMRGDDRQAPFYIAVAQDITEHKQAEAALKEREEIFSSLVGQAMDAIALVDADGRFIEFNTAAHEGLGYTREEFAALTVLDIQERPSAESTRRELEQVRAQGGLVFETRHLHRSGEIRDVRLSLKPLTIRGSEFLATVWTDLTERRRMEESLRGSEEKYRNIIQAAMDGYVLMDMTGRIIGVNESYCRMSGYSADELLKMHASQLDADRSAEEIAAHGRWMMQHGETRFEVRHRRKDGAVYDVEISIQHRAADGGRLVCFLRDISERKKAEKAVRRLETAIEQAAEVIVITDSEGNIEYVNPAFERLTGYSRDEALGQNPRVLKSGEHDDLFYRELWLNISNGGTWRGHLVNKRKDGSIFTEDAAISPVLDKAGRIVNYVAAKRDISEEVRLQGQLFQAQKMESVGRLAGGVAHDFNNMLAVILGHSELALEDVDPAHPVYPALEEIRTAANRSADLVRQLLTFARKQTIAPRVLDINEAVESMLKMVRRLIGENIELTWRPGADVWPVKMDPTQIDQILANLCVNARDAIADVGKISIETGNRVLDEDFSREHLEAVPGEYVLLSVRDDGCGIGQENLGKLFEPFFTTKEVGKGTGLGLATVYGIIRQNNGVMTVDSEVGRGATFRIYLPRTAPSEGRQHTSEPLSQPRRGTETILLVEDEKSILAMGRKILERHGYSVLAASGPREALELAGKHSGRIDLLITDVIMPGMNGKELAVKLSGLVPGFKTLFMSGYTGDALTESAMVDEAVNFLHKPFSLTTLTTKVREVLRS
ncbi:MAG: PAS domain S-box protein [Syntrophobacteraceae bacterium]|nr:PAS domain S-box protein [Syntrophobacteraceae bacterium]